VASLRARNPEPVDRGGVGVAAGIVTWDRARAYKDAMVIAHWKEPDEHLPTMHRRPGVYGATVEKWGEVPAMPMPSFIIGVSNQTDRAVRIQPSQFRLVDGSGHEYPQLGGLSEINARVEAQMIATYRGLLNAPAIRDGLHSKISNLPFLTQPVEIPPHKDWVGYVAFQLDRSNPAEFADFVGRVGGVELRFSDAGGTVSFPFDKTTGTLEVTCPAGEAPSLARCPPGGAAPQPSAFGP
jgi:hypothetical protein